MVSAGGSESLEGKISIGRLEVNSGSADSAESQRRFPSATIDE
jgi:hypothetical protein